MKLYYTPGACSLSPHIALREAGAWLLGDAFSVADGYAYYTLRNWRRLTGSDLSEVAGLGAYAARIAGRPAVRAALAAEGLAP